MSTVSLQLLNSKSPSETQFHDGGFPDPCLSAPSDPDEELFIRSARRLTPGSADLHAPAGNRDTSPTHPAATSSAIDATVDSHTPIISDLTSPLSSVPDLLYGTDEMVNELSDLASPWDDFISDSAQDVHESWHVDASAQVQPVELPRAVEALPPTGTVSYPSQLLSPIQTNPSTPTVDDRGARRPAGSAAHRKSLHDREIQPFRVHRQQLSLHSLDTQSGHEISEGQGVPDSAQSKSPIVKIERWSRGDSPVREPFHAGRRRSHSSTHLSPGHPDEPSSDSDIDESETNQHQVAALVAREIDGSWIRSTSTGQAGVDPAVRGNAESLSPNDLESRRLLDEKNEGIRHWSETVPTVDPGLGYEDSAPVRGRKSHANSRSRAKSAGNPPSYEPYDYLNCKLYQDDAGIPGPGKIIDERIDDEESDVESDLESDVPQSPPASVKETMWERSVVDGPPAVDSPDPEHEEPLPEQFFRPRPWQDAARDSSPRSTPLQPPNSNAAMVWFEVRAKETDRASRTATWGTKQWRDSDINSLLGGQGSIGNLSINPAENSLGDGIRSKYRQLFQAANIHKRRFSTTSNSVSSGAGTGQAEQKDNTTNAKSPIPRKLSIGRSSRSPPPDTGGAILAMTSSLAAVGGRDSLRTASPIASRRASNLPPHRRRKSIGDLRGPSTPGLIDLMTSYGGPPVATIAHSPHLTTSTALQLQQQANCKPKTVERKSTRQDEEDEDEDERAGESGIIVDWRLPARLPIPTLDGFRTQICELNPLLPPALVHRLAHEQDTRYKNLVKQSLKHGKAVREGSCTAKEFCRAQGGAVFLPLRPGRQNAETSAAQYVIQRHEGHDLSNEGLGDGTATVAQFPMGIPLPPVNRLPAEFECPLCFRVKKFQKPSDWTKHVHEDVQPFTCTFPLCNEPKSFKRKADWVRHENELHRKLERWTCNIGDCHHTCYRKDNFVQHLVREHKMPDPKIKKTRANGAAADHHTQLEDFQRAKEIEKLLELVENCRSVTSANALGEPCRFCGNKCTSWKKLTVHLAKHMEQIAMPVLQLLRELGPALDGKAGLNPDQVGSAKVQHDSQAVAQMSQEGDFLVAENFPVPSSTIHPPMSAMQGVPAAGLPETDNPISMQDWQHMPTHQNSVTYPPPFNAVPRQVRPNPQTMATMAQYPNGNTHQLSVSTVDEVQAIYDPHGPLHASPTVDSAHATMLGQMGPVDAFNHTVTAAGAYEYPTTTMTTTNDEMQFVQNEFGNSALLVNGMQEFRAV